MGMRDLAVSCQELGCDRLLDDWRWLVPDAMEPLLIGIFGDWVFGAPDGSHWHLDLLEGRFHRIADGSQDFNAKKEQPHYRNEWFGRTGPTLPSATVSFPNATSVLAGA